MPINLVVFKGSYLIDSVAVSYTHLYKDLPEGQDPLDAIYITPTLERAKEVIEAGADVLGLDLSLIHI